MVYIEWQEGGGALGGFGSEYNGLRAAGNLQQKVTDFSCLCVMILSCENSKMSPQISSSCVL